MEIAITNGIKITVQTSYLADNSRPAHNYFVHAYRITIENQSTEKVQLLRRHWYIYDSAGLIREVEGEGVIGEKPVLAPGDIHQYTSFCPQMTEIGKMHGTFTMQRAKNRELFKVNIPEFQLIATPILN